jgi:LysM repeat protein
MKNSLFFKLLSAYIILIISVLNANAQLLTPPRPSYVRDSILSYKDTLWLTTAAPTGGSANTLFLVHRLKKGQTLYQLADFYKTTVVELVLANPAFAKGCATAAGQLIYVPITRQHLIRTKPPVGFSFRQHLRVLYRVKPNETLYRIGKTYLDIPLDSLRARNRLTTEGVAVGRVLNIGWVPLGGVRIQQEAAKDTTLKTMPYIPESLRNALMSSEKLKENFVTERAIKKEIKEKGVAFWDKYDAGMLRTNSTFFALHRTAPIGTTLKVYNPMSRRTLFVRVIGRIPQVGYANDLLVVLSPYTAKTLGAIDARFHIEVSFLQ